MKIPTYDDVVNKRGRTALEKFVLNNEPAGAAAERKFRVGLQAVVDDAGRGSFRDGLRAAAKFVHEFLEHGGDADDLERGILAIRPPRGG